MKIVLLAIALVVLVVCIAIIVKHTTSSTEDTSNLITSTSGTRLEKNITIKGSSTGNNITISVNSLGQISFKQTITKTVTDTIDPKDIVPNSGKTLSKPTTVTTNITRDFVYTTRGNFYTRTVLKQGANKPKIFIKAYDLSKGPLPPFSCYSIVDKLKSIGYSDPNKFFTPKVRSLFDNALKTNVLPKVAEYNKKFGTNIIITNIEDYINTTWFNVAGIRDRLYQPNKTINSKFLGLSNVKIYTGTTAISAPTWASKVNIETTISKSIIKNIEGKDQVIDKTIEFPKYKSIDPFKLPFKENGYNEKMVQDNLSEILLNPLSGIDFQKIEEEINNNPLPETGYKDLSTIVDAVNDGLFSQSDEDRAKNIQAMINEPHKYRLINNLDPNYADKEEGYYYYPVDTPKTNEEIRQYTTLHPSVKRPAILYGIVKMPAQKVREQGVKLAEELQKRYDNCRYQIQKVKQPFTDGNACQDSQDAALAHYVYNTAKDCDMVRIGDVWCSYDTTNSLDPSGGDNMLTCEWGKQKHESGNIQDYEKITFTFEGTEVNVFDWMADLCVIPFWVPELGCNVHLGFWSKFVLWIPKILKGLRARVAPGNPSKITTRFKKVILIGHSLGGAMASLAAAYIQAICVDSIEVEVASQGAPSPFWLSKPLGSFFIKYPKRFKGYFHDECFFNPNRDDPVPDILYIAGFWHWFDFEAPVRRGIRRGWSWDFWDGGWWRCNYEGGYFDTEENWISLLRITLDVLGGFVLGEVVDALLGFALEHTITEYFPKISNTQCPGAWDPTPDVDFDQVPKAGFCNNSRDCLNGGQCTVIDPEGYKCSNYSG